MMPAEVEEEVGGDIRLTQESWPALDAYTPGPSSTPALDTIGEEAEQVEEATPGEPAPD